MNQGGMNIGLSAHDVSMVKKFHQNAKLLDEGKNGRSIGSIIKAFLLRHGKKVMAVRQEIKKI